MLSWIAVILTFTLPGLPVAVAAWRRVPALRSVPLLVGAVPLVSMAITFTIVMFAPVGSISRAFSIAVLVVAALATAAAFRLPVREPEFRPALDRSALLAAGAIVIAAAVGTTAWISGMPDLDQPPPNYDAAAHGFMTARIIDTGTNWPDRVVISGPDGQSGSAGYYPLGIHSSAAVATALGGQSVARTLNIVVVLFAAMLYPVACYVLVREVLPFSLFAAPMAALASTAFEAYPYKPMGWGGIGLVVGNVAAFASAALVVRVIRTCPRDWWAAVLAALAAVGVFHIHNSEVVVAGALVVLMVLTDLPTRADGAALPIQRSLFIGAWQAIWRIGVVSFIALVTLIPAVVRGGSERSSFDDTPLGDPLTSLGQILFMQAGLRRQGTLLLLAIIGMAVLVRRRKYALPLAFSLVILGAYWTATTDNPVSSALTFPWWRQPERMMYVVSMFASLGLGVAVAAALDPLVKVRRAPVALRWASVAVLVGALGAVVLRPGAEAGRTMVYRSYFYFSPMSEVSRQGYEVAATLAGDDGTVLNDFNRDGSLWMYAYTGASPIYALELADHSSDSTWPERMTLVSKMALIGTDPEQDALVEKYRVRAVYFDENTYSGSEHSTTRDALRAAPGLHEVFTDGSVSVFAVVRTENSSVNGR